MALAGSSLQHACGDEGAPLSFYRIITDAGDGHTWLEMASR
jgi:hypothetical protein